MEVRIQDLFDILGCFDSKEMMKNHHLAKSLADASLGEHNCGVSHRYSNGAHRGELPKGCRGNAGKVVLRSYPKKRYSGAFTAVSPFLLCLRD